MSLSLPDLFNMPSSYLINRGRFVRVGKNELQQFSLSATTSSPYISKKVNNASCKINIWFIYLRSAPLCIAFHNILCQNNILSLMELPLSERPCLLSTHQAQVPVSTRESCWCVNQLHPLPTITSPLDVYSIIWFTKYEGYLIPTQSL